MKSYPEPLDLSQLRVFPLKTRKSLSEVSDILIDPASDPAFVNENIDAILDHCARKILKAQARGANIILAYGAHLLRNGAAQIIDAMMKKGWITHLATNGAGTIHDWEFAFLGRSSENVRANVATGTFGTWDETGRFLNLALLRGGISREGYGNAIGKMIAENGLSIPKREKLIAEIVSNPADSLAAARAELLFALDKFKIKSGWISIEHKWKRASILAQAFAHKVPVSVHPGIGYDIIANHPMFNGAAIGRAAARDFRLFSSAVEGLDGGVMLSIGSAIMAPQVFEKSLSCVNNLRMGRGENIVSDHSIFVVDLQDGGKWDWKIGEPPKTNPAYYLRFCKSFARMGGEMHYAQCDNVAFIHQLFCKLMKK